MGHSLLSPYTKYEKISKQSVHSKLERQALDYFPFENSYAGQLKVFRNLCPCRITQFLKRPQEEQRNRRSYMHNNVKIPNTVHA